MKVLELIYKVLLIVYSLILRLASFAKSGIKRIRNKRKEDKHDS